MPVLKIFDKVKQTEQEVRVDKEDFEKFKGFKYVTDKVVDKPYREEKVEGKVRKIFLAREVRGCGYGDGTVVTYKNGNYLDCREENLIVKARSVRKECFWPFTFKSLLNFLDKHEGSDEDTCSLYLSKAIDVKYSHKKITLVYDADTYKEFQDKAIMYLLKRTLNRYFQWTGELAIVKSVKVEKAPAIAPVVDPVVPVLAPTIPIASVDKKEEMPIMLERASEKIRAEKDRVDGATEGNFLTPDIRSIEREFAKLNLKHRVEIVKKSLPIEELIKIVMEKGSASNAAMTIQFTSK